MNNENKTHTDKNKKIIHTTVHTHSIHIHMLNEYESIIAVEWKKREPICRLRYNYNRENDK